MALAQYTRFVEGLRVTPLHLAHLQETLAEAVRDLRTVIGVGQIGYGLRIEVQEGSTTTVNVSPGLGFSASGERLTIGEGAPVDIPADGGPVQVVLANETEVDPASEFAEEGTIVFASTVISLLPVDETPAPAMLAIGTVTPGPDGLTIAQDQSLFLAPGLHGHTGEHYQDGEGRWRFDGPLLSAGAGDVGPAGPPGAPGPQGEPGEVGPEGPAGQIGPAGPDGPSGLAGPPGPQGEAGPRGEGGGKGEVGPAGPSGAPGEPGTIGPVGPAGPAGTIGERGPKGVVGEPGLMGGVGPPGPAGAKGDTGERGQQGAVGPAGPASTKGDKGDPGELGPRGPQGDKGETGDTGKAGEIGPAGPLGERGPQGEQGPIGPDGKLGPKGPKGDPGAIGPRGVKGTGGAKGAKGDAGATGKQGDRGLPGAVGETGATGPTGKTGVKGAKGDTGATGKTGRVGPAGPKGAKGDTGPAGPKGATGGIGPVGPSGRNGNAGSRGLAGIKGASGARGETGLRGAQGVPGPKGAKGDPGSVGRRGPQGPPGSAEFDDLVHVVGLPWRVDTAISLPNAFTLLSRMTFKLSGPIEPLLSKELLLLAMRVSIVANAPLSPDMVVRGMVETGGATLTWRTTGPDLEMLRGFVSQLEAGFFLTVEIDCNQLLGANGLPMSSSTSMLYGGPERPLVPGGLVKLRAGVTTARRPDIRFFRQPFKGSRKTPFVPGSTVRPIDPIRRPSRPTRPTIVSPG